MLARRHAGAQHHECGDGLAPFCVWQTDDRNLIDRGMQRNHVLNLLGDDAAAAGADDVV